MSRRESRVSMNVRQNDALFEFENFKKKFLLANKHITKLNSTLSMKIEELNTEIATLCSENLRLRTSEIALSAQLKREREKSRKIMSDAETATQALMSQFGFLRQTFNIPVHAPPSPTPTPPRRPTSSPRNSTYANNVNRLAREPQVSNIHEDEEPEEVPPSPRKTKKKARLSASKLPLPARSSTPPITLGTPAPSAPVLAPPHLDLSVLALPTKKRRQSGLLLDLGVVDIDALGVDEETEYEQPRDKEKEVKRRTRDDGTLLAAVIKPKPKLKDVTNANPPRSRSKTDTALDSALAPLTLETQVQARAFLVAAPASPPPPEPQPRPVPTQLAVAPPEPPPQPVSSGSSSSLDSASDRASEQRGYTTEPTSAAPEAETGGRERRTRKSVNYTEPKLNTKMRKSGLPAGSVPAQDPAPTKRSRSSAAAAVPVSSSGSGSSSSSGNTTRRPSPPLRTSTRPPPPLEGSDVEEDGEESDGWADGEYVPSWGATSHVNVEGRRRTPAGRPRKGEAGVVVEEWAREREKEARRHSAVV